MNPPPSITIPAEDEHSTAARMPRVAAVGTPVQFPARDDRSPQSSSTVPVEGQTNGPANRPSHDSPVPRGERDQNPSGIGLVALLREDFRTHGKNLLEPGFWAVAIHRLGNARMNVRPKLLRTPFSIAYHVASTGVDWLWGIDLSYAVKLGRRVRIWHHGGIVLNARAIGDDVTIRHNTTFGVARTHEHDDKPIIGNRVDVGVGVCVLGAVTVGDGCHIGANSVVLSDLPPESTAVGAPAHPVHRVHGNGNGHHHPPQQQAPHDRGFRLPS